MKPLISIVMPVWNGEQFLASAIESCLAQTFTEWELLVIDDGSEDGTDRILESFTDERIKVHHRPHGGIVAALNFGVEQARSAWIARQDADDISLPQRLALQWAAVQRNPQVVLCFSEVVLWDGVTEEPSPARLPRSRAFIALRLCYQSPFAHSTVLFARHAFQAAGGYRPAERHAEDYALWGRLLENGPFIALPEPLLKLRLHPASVSQQNLTIQRDLSVQIATTHCRQFMNLNRQQAERAAQILRSASGQRGLRDWLWFLTHCAPRLRWKSVEAWGWLAWQTVKRLTWASDSSKREA